ncbi:MAG TPA: hypothetical protein H9832_00385 [Candidatus Agathobaculum merdavium]|nr:hypothetical protein [Candidatus Agathobaculum merdavium]
MRTVGLIFYEEAENTSAVKSGVVSPEAGPSAQGAGTQTLTPAQDKALEEMTVTELRSFAASHGIDVTGAAKKPDLLLAVQTALGTGSDPETAQV